MGSNVVGNVEVGLSLVGNFVVGGNDDPNTEGCDVVGDDVKYQLRVGIMVYSYPFVGCDVIGCIVVGDREI